MNPDFAKGLAAMTLPDIAHEWQTTKKVIAAIPADGCDYQPHERCMKLLDLAWHLVSADIWFLEGIGAGAFGDGGGSRPENVKTPADCIAYYESKVGPATAAIEALSGEQLAENQSFFGVFNLPRVSYLNFLQKHSIHHRGQLSAYLRPAGGRVPSIYGGSADEPFQPAASKEAAQA